MNEEKDLNKMIENATTENFQSILPKLAEITSEVEKESSINKLAAKLKIPKKAIQTDLQTHIKSKILNFPAKNEEIFKEEDRKKATSLLKAPNLMEKFLKMAERVGIVKEEINKRCLYLAYTSRKLKEPISIIVKGQSSAGKSYLSNTILENFIPKDDFYSYSRITPQSLYYRGDKTLSHKILAVFEKEGTSEADYSIRTYISEKNLKILSTIKNTQTGEFESKDIIIEGPIQFTSTTTQKNLNPENLTRVFTLYVDDSPGKIKASLEEIAKKYTRIQDVKVQDNELRIWRCAQTLLVCQRVMIPFAHSLIQYFPTDITRTQRDFQRFLSLIEASALLHQYQRSKNNGAIIASSKDYEIAREIGDVVLNQTIKKITSKTEDLLKVIRSNFTTSKFTRKDLENKTGWHYQSVRRSVEELLREGYIALYKKKGSGGADNYTLKNNPVKLINLPTKEEVERYPHDKVTKFTKSKDNANNGNNTPKKNGKFVGVAQRN
jgi:Mn-dependent DtxR family transcriptional regulator